MIFSAYIARGGIVSEKILEKMYGVDISILPPKFLSEIKEDNLAEDGYWKTYAFSVDEAKDRIADFVKFITGEILDTTDIVVVPIERKKKMSLKINFNGKGNSERSLRGHANK